MKNEELSVSNFIRFMISMSGIYNVDEEGYITHLNDMDKRIKLPVNKVDKNLLIFNENMSNSSAIIINPLVENIGEDEIAKWFYYVLSCGFSKKLMTVLNAIVSSCITKEDMSVEVAKMVSEFCGEIDDKTADELELLMKDVTVFSNVYYRKKFKEARWRSIVFEKEQRDGLKIRKKTWKVIDQIFLKIFGLTTGDISEVNEKYSHTSNLFTCPRLDGTLKLYYKLYSQLNPYIAVLGEGHDDDDNEVVDLDEMSHYIEGLDDLYKKVKWFVAASVPASNTVKEEREFSPLNHPATTALHPHVGNEPYYPTTPDGVPIVMNRPPNANVFGYGAAIPGEGSSKYMVPFTQGYGGGVMPGGYPMSSWNNMGGMSSYGPSMFGNSLMNSGGFINVG